jgi:hypothetical protein
MEYSRIIRNSGSADRENSRTGEEIGTEEAWAQLFASLYRTG